MRTTAQACRDLGVSWHTLDLWMKKLGIEATRHEYDLRLWMLSEEDIERIREARAAVPRAGLGRLYVPLPSVRVPQPREVAPKPEQIVVYLTNRGDRSELPDGLESVSGFMRRHGLTANHEGTWREARDRGWLQVVKYDGEGKGWLHNGTYVTNALDAAGRRQAWERWHTRDEWWIECDECAATQHHA